MQANAMIWAIGANRMHAELETGQYYQIARVSQVRDKRKDSRHYRLKLPNGERITHKAFFPLLQIANSDYAKSFPRTPFRPLSKYNEHAWCFDMTDGEEKAQLTRGNHIFTITRGIWVGQPKVSDPLAVFHNGGLLGKKLNFFAAVADCQKRADEGNLG